MDAVKAEAKKAAGTVDSALRRPLVPSEKNIAAPAPRRREVASRFKAGVPPAPAPAASSARRCTSPSLSRPSAAECTASTNRAQSAERRRSSTPSSSSTPSGGCAASRSRTPVRDTTATEVRGISRRATSTKPPDGLWASARRSSPWLQPESVAMATPATKRDRLPHVSSSDQSHQTKVQPRTVAEAERKRSPLRGRNIGNQCENARPSETPNKRVVEQHRWPAAMMSGRGSAGLTSRNNGVADTPIRSVTPSNTTRGHSPRRIYPADVKANGLNQPLNGLAKRLAMHESRRDDKTESSTDDVSSQTSECSKSAARPSRTLSSPVPVLHRSSSPNKVLSAASSTSTNFQSPSRTRPSAPCRSRCCSTASGVTQPVFNYIVDARKVKKSASQIENIHQLRLLYNSHLQWQFVNARSEDTLSFQKSSVESVLYSVWKSILKLRDSVTVRRTDVQLLQQELKLYYILKEQIAYLQHWPALEGENGSTLIGAIEALQACTLRLPVTSGAQADAVAVKNSISSAVDVMQALSSSILYLLSKVEGRTSLVSELSDMARQEKGALGECRELLATAAKLQVQESSLRTHLMQLREGVLG
ncbi:QWRF motif-containing protein 4-like isoform X1 [Oryza brachyantha]|nr:QWRF motif-containing protein 4-like isoform X1 [Oryza brachyantha]